MACFFIPIAGPSTNVAEMPGTPQLLDSLKITATVAASPEQLKCPLELSLGHRSSEIYDW
jgi:hypothetical protein